jgi:hypothetical protein
LSPCVSTVSFSSSSPSGVHLPIRLIVPSILESKPCFHLSHRCCFVQRSNWNQRGNCGPVLDTVHCTASFSLLTSSSSSAHVPVPVRPFARSMLGSKMSFHLFLHWFIVRPGTRTLTTAQSLPPCVCTASFNLLSSSSAHFPVRLVAPSMLESKPFFHLSRHCCSV